MAAIPTARNRKVKPKPVYAARVQRTPTTLRAGAALGLVLALCSAMAACDRQGGDHERTKKTVEVAAMEPQGAAVEAPATPPSAPPTTPEAASPPPPEIITELMMEHGDLQLSIQHHGIQTVSLSSRATLVLKARPDEPIGELLLGGTCAQVPPSGPNVCQPLAPGAERIVTPLLVRRSQVNCGPWDPNVDSHNLADYRVLLTACPAP
ncbi:MAG: hypothetical protein OXR73_12845 [Myxococcales bacterium]|nr:hypothetical protein [Myxococcales bacterium]